MSPLLASSLALLRADWTLSRGINAAGAPAATASLIAQVNADLAMAGVDVAAELAVAA